MEAYNVKRDIKVRIIDDKVKLPPESISVEQGDVVTILSLDGMYCNVLTENNEITYIAAWTEVEEI
jgi:hypothetical protein